MIEDKLAGVSELLEIANRINVGVIVYIKKEDNDDIKKYFRTQGLLVCKVQDVEFEQYDTVKIRKNYSVTDKELNNIEIDYENDTFIYMSNFIFDTSFFHNVTVDEFSKFVVLRKMGGSDEYVTHINNLMLNNKK